MDQALQEAQRRLEQKRQELKVSQSTAPQNLLDILPAICPTTPNSGDDAHRDLDPYCVEKCQHFSVCGSSRVDECRAEAAKAEKRKQLKVAESLKGICIGVRYQNMAFADYKPVDAVSQKVLATCERYAATFPERLYGCDNLLMLGNPGTGKNMLAACVCTSVALQGYAAIHTTAIKLVRKIKESWRQGSEMTEQQAIDQFSKPDLLVIDEVGVQYGSDTEKILLFEVINDRYEAMKPTIIISNLDDKGVESYLGPRIIDRFHEGKSTVLEFTWKSYRRKG